MVNRRLECAANRLSHFKSFAAERLAYVGNLNFPPSSLMKEIRRFIRKNARVY